MPDAVIPGKRRGTRALAVLVAAATIAGAGASGAGAAGTSGGTVPPAEPVFSGVTCSSRCIGPNIGTIGSKIRITGAALESVRVVSMPRADGTRAKDRDPVVKSSTTITAYIKAGAVTGTVRLAGDFGLLESPAAFEIGTEAQLLTIQKRYVFPIRGKHTYGDGLGAKRQHQGQDIFARCGTRLRAAHTGTVVVRNKRGPEGSAGHYVGLFDIKTRTTHMYLHLRKRALVGLGDQVTTGTLIGYVGASGNASGCHLHFEIRKGKRGWLGKVTDPAPSLRYWDSYS